MSNVTLYNVDNANDGEHYCITFESREAADLYNNLWERYTAGTFYGAERFEEGCTVEDAKHVWTLAEVQACDSDDWGTLAENVSDLCNVDNCDYTFVAVEIVDSGVTHAGERGYNYLILNRQTGEKRWLKECILFDEAAFSKDDWDELLND